MFCQTCVFKECSCINSELRVLKHMATTTVKLSKESVDFMKSEGKYGETLADICERLFGELRALRQEKREKSV